jgi:hypothetical protein
MARDTLLSSASVRKKETGSHTAYNGELSIPSPDPARSDLVGIDVPSQAAGQQLAEPFEDRVGRSRDMRIDPLQVAQQIKVQRAGLDAFDPAGAYAAEMRLGRARLEIAEDLLLAEQATHRPRVVRQEHRGRVLEPRPARHREGVAALPREALALVQIAGTSEHSLLRRVDFRPETPRSRLQAPLGLEDPDAPV